MMSKLWQGDWHERAHAAVARLGYATVTEFARAHGGELFDALAERLGLAPIQLKLLLKEEAVDGGDVRTFAADALSRILNRYLPHGWTNSEIGEYAKAQAFADWLVLLGPDHEDVGERIWDEFRRQELPDGWIASPADPILLEMFERSWE